MALPFQFDLSESQERELEWAVKHAPKAYVRMKAAAILKVKRGQSMRQVALHGLLHPVAEETVAKWIRRYLAEGLAGLLVRRGRGRKPAFSPCGASAEVEVAVYQLQETLQQAPEVFGLSQSRWTLAGVRQAVPWLAPLSLPGVWGMLERFDLVYKRGRRYVHSPDLEYPLKAARLRCIAQQVQADAGHLVLLYEDELTYYRCPTVAQDYALRGTREPRAVQGSGYNSARRIAACLDACTGRLICWQREAFDHHTFLRYLLAVQDCYPHAERVFIALDNWPVHFQPDLLAALQSSKLTLVFLPTYAPWLNPTEKVWRKLKQEVLHLHRSSSRWKDLQQRVQDWLNHYDQPSPDLLRYVGLSPT